MMHLKLAYLVIVFCFFCWPKCIFGQTDWVQDFGDNHIKIVVDNSAFIDSTHSNFWQACFLSDSTNSEFLLVVRRLDCLECKENENPQTLFQYVYLEGEDELSLFTYNNNVLIENIFEMKFNSYNCIELGIEYESSTSIDLKRNWIELCFENGATNIRTIRN